MHGGSEMSTADTSRITPAIREKDDPDDQSIKALLKRLEAKLDELLMIERLKQKARMEE